MLHTLQDMLIRFLIMFNFSFWPFDMIDRGSRIISTHFEKWLCAIISDSRKIIGKVIMKNCGSVDTCQKRRYAEHIPSVFPRIISKVCIQFSITVAKIPNQVSIELVLSPHISINRIVLLQLLWINISRISKTGAKAFAYNCSKLDIEQSFAFDGKIFIQMYLRKLYHFLLEWP